MLLATFEKDTIAGAAEKEMEKRSVDAEGNNVVIPEKELAKLNRKATLCAVRKVLTIWLNRQYTGGGYFCHLYSINQSSKRQDRCLGKKRQSSFFPPNVIFSSINMKLILLC